VISDLHHFDVALCDSSARRRRRVFTLRTAVRTVRRRPPPLAAAKRHASQVRVDNKQSLSLKTCHYIQSSVHSPPKRANQKCLVEQSKNSTESLISTALIFHDVRCFPQIPDLNPLHIITAVRELCDRLVVVQVIFLLSFHRTSHLSTVCHVFVYGSFLFFL
jgi:hypothetical protein